MHPAERTRSLEFDQAAAFDQALEGFHDLPFTPGFEALLAHRGISEEADTTPDYWRAAADYALSKAAHRYEQGDDPGAIAIDTLPLLTPNLLHTHVQVHKARERGEQLGQNNRNYLSSYNSLLRQAAVHVPGLHASSLLGLVMNAANATRDPLVLATATAELHTYIRGAQHEAAFGDLLDETGLEYREATPKEDRGGVDYVANTPVGVQFLDVKASSRRVGDNHHIARRRADGSLEIYSMVTDKELKDGFALPDDFPGKADRVQYLTEILSSNWHEAVAG